jgi:hypothetical protein
VVLLRERERDDPGALLGVAVEAGSRSQAADRLAVLVPELVRRPVEAVEVRPPSRLGLAAVVAEHVGEQRAGVIGLAGEQRRAGGLEPLQVLAQSVADLALELCLERSDLDPGLGLQPIPLRVQPVEERGGRAAVVLVVDRDGCQLPLVARLAIGLPLA